MLPLATHRHTLTASTHSTSYFKSETGIKAFIHAFYLEYASVRPALSHMHVQLFNEA